MPDVRTSCPSAKQLSDFGLGKLPPGELSAIHAHLTQCPQCRKKVAEQPPDSFVGQLRAGAPQASNTLLPRRTSDTPTTLDDLPPELAASSKYEVLSKLGEGGMGAVYKARHTFLNELVAIKVMNATALANPEARGRFLREMQAVGQLKHKNIVRALDAEQMGELLVLVMEYVEGITLDRLVAQKGILPVSYSCHCIVRATLGLQYAHEKGMVHRDIKPANLILAAKEKEIKLLDFGLARGTREQKAKNNHTQIGVPMGTPAYMAPEQVTDASSVDIRADIYSLGCTLYFLMAGQSPFQRDSAMTTMMAQVTDEARPLTEVRPDVSAELWEVMAKMLAKKPEDRYQTPKEVEQALRPFMSGGEKAVQAVDGTAKAKMHAAATMLPGNTSKLNAVPSPSRMQSAEAPAEKSSPFILPASDSAAGRGRRQKAKGKKPWLTWKVWVGGVAAFLMAAVLFGAVVLILKTPGGKVVVEIDQADAEVFVDGVKQQIRLRVPGEKESIEITVNDDKEHTLKVKKGGFETETRKFTYRTSKGETIRVALRPEKPNDDRKNQIREKQPQDEFVPLFNGKDLKGWVVDSGDENAWKVKNGELVAQGTAVDDHVTQDDYLTQGYLLTKGKYTSFQLRFQFQQSNNKVLSGIALRAKLHERAKDSEPYYVRNEDDDFPFHLTVGIGKARGQELTGVLWWSPNSVIQPVLFPDLAAELKPIGDWNEMEVELRGERLRVTINSRQVQNVMLNETRPEKSPALGLSRSSGRIGFMKRTGEIRFRKIEIKELSKAAAK